MYLLPLILLLLLLLVQLLLLHGLRHPKPAGSILPSFTQHSLIWTSTSGAITRLSTRSLHIYSVCSKPFPSFIKRQTLSLASQLKYVVIPVIRSSLMRIYNHYFHLFLFICSSIAVLLSPRVGYNYQTNSYLRLITFFLFSCIFLLICFQLSFFLPVKGHFMHSFSSIVLPSTSFS